MRLRQHATKPWRAVRGWPVWSLRQPALVTVLVVELLALVITVTVADRVPISRGDWLIMAILGGCAILHTELVRRVDRIREGVRSNVPYVDLKSVWTFAGVLLLPPVLAVGLVVLTYVHMRWRVARVQVFRSIYSTATVVLATLAASAVLYAGLPSGDYPGLPSSARGVGVIIVAALIRWFVNHGLVVTAIVLSSPKTSGKEAVGTFADNVVEVAAAALGGITALAVVRDPWYLALIMPLILVLHRSLLMRQYELAARTDSKTGLANSTHWSQMARGELSRAGRDNTKVGILMLDLDHFKRVNDTYGHLTGDAVLKAVADALRRESRDYDLVGRFGGEEFMVLLPGLDAADLPATAERFRRCIGNLAIRSPDNHETVTVTASAGAVAFPDGGEDLDELLLAADAALYRAKETGRDRTCMAPSAAVRPKPGVSTETDLPPQSRTGD